MQSYNSTVRATTVAMTRFNRTRTVQFLVKRLKQVDELAIDNCTPVNASNLVMDAFVNIFYIISQIDSLCPAIKLFYPLEVPKKDIVN